MRKAISRCAARGRGGCDRSGDAQGDLVLRSAGAAVLQLQKPFAYQERDGVRQEISAGYVLDGRQVSFAIGAYDSTRPLVIDPVLVYATRLGGGGADGPQ